MGFVSFCFGSCKNRKVTQTALNPTLAKYQIAVKCEQSVQPPKPVEEVSDSVDSNPPISQSKDKIDDQLDSSPRIKVTFSSDIKTYEEVSTVEVALFSLENDKEEESEEMKPNIGKQEVADSAEKICKEEREKEENQNQTFLDPSMSSMISYPPIHRYKNTKSAGMKLELQKDGGLLHQEETSDSLFSLSIDSRKKVNAAEINDKEVNSPIRFGQNWKVLNSVDNLTPWKKESKAVTVDTNVEVDDQEKTSDSLFSLSIESRKKANAAEINDKEINSPIRFGPNQKVLNSVENLTPSKKESKAPTIDTNVEVDDQKKASDSLFSLSIESRKKVNAAEIDDKEVNSPITVGPNQKVLNSVENLTPWKKGSKAPTIDTSIEVDDQEKTSDSLFSLSIESRKKVNAAEIDDKEVNSPITVGPNQKVLNSVENITPWKKESKAPTIDTSLEDQEKENIDLRQRLDIIIPFSEEEPSFKKSNPNSRLKRASRLKTADCEFAVDTSLSSWLVEYGQTPIMKENPSSMWDSSNSSRKFDDRPILGALTVEELKQHSVNSSPRKSPSRFSPDEMPIIGSVGSYWSPTGKNISSLDSDFCRSRVSPKFREDKRVQCYSVSSSPRKSPSHFSPDETPIIGTVGSYWSHMEQKIGGSSELGSSRTRMSTKFRENKKLNCNSTPFVERLERA